MVRFNIVIPLYNKEDHIVTTLKSVLSQSYTEFKVIVINDGSTDGSERLVKQIDDNRIFLYSVENGGVAAARNYGIDKADEDSYIAFLDADDTWEIAYLYEMAELIKMYPQCGMFGSAYKVVKENGEIIRCGNVKEGLVENYFKLILKEPVFWTSATIVKRSVFNELGGFPVGMVSGEDSYTWCKIAIHYPCAFSPKVLANYNLHDGSLLTRYSKIDTAKEFWWDFFKEDEEERNEYIALKGLMAGIRYAFNGNRERSRAIQRVFSYTKYFRKKWLLLSFLNIAPKFVLERLLVLKMKKNKKYLKST